MIAQRTASLLGFVGVVTALMPAAIGLGKGHVRYTWPIKITLVIVLVVLTVAAVLCLRVLSLRDVSIQNVGQLRRQWDCYSRGGLRGTAQAQIAHPFLGGEPTLDPLATVRKEADSRAACYRWAVSLLFTALAVISVLAAQLLFQQV